MMNVTAGTEQTMSQRASAWDYREQLAAPSMNERELVVGEQGGLPTLITSDLSLRQEEEQIELPFLSFIPENYKKIEEVEEKKEDSDSDSEVEFVEEVEIVEEITQEPKKKQKHKKVWKKKATVLFEKTNLNKLKYLQQFYRKELISKDPQLLMKLENYQRQSRSVLENDILSKEVRYCLGKNGKGRWYPKCQLSLANMPRDVRAFLCNDYYVEVDACNCNPSIALSLGRQMDIKLPILQDYCDNRDKWFAELKKEFGWSRSECKDAILMTCFGIGDKKLRHTVQEDKLPKKIARLKEEMLQLAERLRGGRELEKGENPFSELSITLQDWERRMMLVVIDFLKKGGYKIGAWIFDGVLVEKAKAIDKGVLDAVSMEVWSELELDVRFGVKELEQSKFEYDETEVGDEQDEIVYRVKDGIDRIEKEFRGFDHYMKTAVEIIDESEGVEIIAHFIAKLCKYCNGSYFWKNDYLWTELTEKTMQDRLVYCIQKFKLTKAIGKKTVVVTRQSGFVNKFRGLLMAMISTTCGDDDFLETIWKKTLKRLAFLDGYYDFATKTFVPWDENVEGIEFIAHVPRNFPTKVDKKVRDELNERLWDVVITDAKTRKYVKESLCRAIAGMITDKRWFVFLGQRDCGKGAIVEALLTAFGGQMVVSTNAENFLVDRQSTSDMEKKLKFLIPCQFARLLFTSECSVSNAMFDNNIFKKICSGGDVLDVRALYAAIIKIRLQTTLMMWLNNMPVVSGTDCLQKLSTIFMNTEFKDAKEVNDRPHYKLRDEGIKDWLRDERVGDQLILDILDHWQDCLPEQPDSVLQELEEDNDSSDEQKFYSHFEFTGNKEDVVVARDLTAFLKDLMGCKETEFTIKKMRHLIQLRCGDVTLQKIDNKATRVYKGLKIIEES